MRYGIFSPPFGFFSDPRVLADLAHEAEAAGWDGYFLWDHMRFAAPPGATGGPPEAPVGDPWVTLAAMGLATERIRLGALVTPLPRRRPWKVARETVALDVLTDGRLVVGVGIGSDRFGHEYSGFGESTDDRLHGAMLDEALDVLTGLWRGEPLRYAGRHYQVHDVTFLPRPVQQPRIPIWVGGFWPNPAPFRRAARWDGVMPVAARAMRPDDYRAMGDFIARHRTATRPYDVVRAAPFPSGSPAEARATLAAYAAAGVTWWLLPIEDDMAPLAELRARIRQGPPAEE